MINLNESLVLPNEQTKINFGYYFSVLANRRYLILMSTLLCFAVAVVVVKSMTSSYVASAVLLLESNQKNVLSIEDIYNVDTDKKEYFQTQYELLKSRSIAEELVTQFGLDEVAEFNGSSRGQGAYPYWLSFKEQLKVQFKALQSFIFPDKPQQVEQPNPDLLLERKRQVAIANFQSKIAIKPIRNTQLVTVQFQSSDPLLARDIANAIVETYIQNNLDSRLAVNQQADDWINQRIDLLKAAIADSEKRLTEFLESEGLVDVKGIDNLINDELQALNRQIADARNKRITAESIYTMLKDKHQLSLNSLSSNLLFANNPQLRDSHQAEIEAEKKVSEFSKRYGPKHDKMIQAQAQLAAARERSQTLINQLTLGAQKELASAREKEATVLRALEEKKGDFQGVAVKRANYDALKRELESNKNLYDLFVSKQKENSAASDYKTTIAKFVDPAVTPLSPAKPAKAKLVILGTFLGFFTSVLFAFFSQSLRNSLDNRKDVEDKLQLTPLGCVPVYKTKKKQEMDAGAFCDEKQSYFAESIRGIRTSLLLMMGNQARKSTMICSSLPSEGKTSIAINLAVAMAKVEKVLLIDADLRQPSIGHRFSISATRPGLTNLIAMNIPIDECVLHHEATRLNILPAGLYTANPQEYLTSNRFSELIKYFERHYDRIIIDTPPTIAFADSLLIGKYVGSSVVVVKAGDTELNQVKQTLTKFAEQRIALDGIVLNQVSENATDYQYYEGYMS